MPPTPKPITTRPASMQASAPPFQGEVPFIERPDMNMRRLPSEVVARQVKMEGLRPSLSASQEAITAPIAQPR